MALTLSTSPDSREKARYDVGGVLLERPFKIRRLGHFGFNVTRIAEGLHFYVDLLGFVVSDEIDFGARLSPEQAAQLSSTRGVFTRHGGDHHSFVLFPREPLEYDVDGILLARPFKITKIGPVRLFVQDLDQSLDYYTRGLGFTVTTEVDFEGHRCVFLRANMEHHSLALYPLALRERLGLST